MTAVHFLYDLSFFSGYAFRLPLWLTLLARYGHLFFILISGICATLGHHSFRRGMAVFSAGLLVSYGTLFGELILGMGSIRIWFGILHLLGSSMMLYPLFRQLPPWTLAVIGTLLVILGQVLTRVRVPVDFLFPLGLRSGRIDTGNDFFPLLPGFGWFLLGACLGKTIYRNRQSLLPGFSRDSPVLKFFCFCGRNSLFLYLLHQPILVPISLLL